MLFKCKPADFEAIKNAPFYYKYSGEIPASAETVFKLFEDEHSWPLWFPLVKSIKWTTPKPFQVGTTRNVYDKNGFCGSEYFYAWKPGREFGFYFTKVNVPIFKMFAELYELTPIDDNRCVFTLHVGIDTIWLVKAAKPISSKLFSGYFKDAPQSLAAYVERNYS